MKTTVREASGGVQIVDLKGKITIGAGDVDRAAGTLLETLG